MRSIITLMAMLLILLTSACRGDERPKMLVYGYVSQENWPIIGFPRFWNSPFGNQSAPIGQLFGGLWGSGGNTLVTAIYFEEAELVNTLRFDATWFEVFTGEFYKARIEVDVRDLHYDWLRKDAGQIVLRIGRNGEVQIVSARTNIDPLKTKITVLKTVCGEAVVITDPFIISEIERVMEFLNREGYLKHRNKAVPVPSSCE